MSKLQGKTAVITGGASGIGLASAKRFVAEGAFVYLFGRRRDALDRAMAELGPNARAVQGDVTIQADLDRLFEAMKAERGGVDIVFANAGIGETAPLGAITPAHFDHAFDINVRGLLFTVQTLMPLLKPGSSIVLTGSTVGVMGTPAMSVYSASKAAVRNLARSWAQDLRGSGIRVNVLSPGLTQTEMVMDILDESVLAGIVAGTPTGRMGDPMETAAVAAFLASDDSSFMTGSEVFVDGGYAQI
ncbi:SDR family NAD(P)-dependent oxidoreductase [Marinivivus vitaminiproducens]|uniref:SDR family NAD(P)-dependent oxidoreductase n=1 Tax=Marinivivus vitaminiproducens TaxID=3035935 RepID=UPI00279C63F2|nr:SDR family oxidoreductase [Geminicoccaceae bacterium SCSIO 64248]